MADLSFIYLLGFGIIVAGVIILVAAILLATIFQGKNAKVKAAGVVIVGPVPIVFGSDKKMVKDLLTLSIVLTALLIAFTLIYYFLLR